MERESFRVMGVVRFFLFGWCATSKWRTHRVASLAQKMRELAPSPPAGIDISAVYSASSLIEVAVGQDLITYPLGSVRTALLTIAGTGGLEAKYLLDVFDAGAVTCGYSLVSQNDTNEGKMLLQSIRQWSLLLNETILSLEFLCKGLPPSDD